MPPHCYIIRCFAGGVSPAARSSAARGPVPVPVPVHPAHLRPMSGFAGIVRFDGSPPPWARLEAMLDHVSHRGPDGAATSIHPGCGLAHARLSIIDLLAGDQPMHLSPPRDASDPAGADATAHGSRGPLHCVFNGEIYNHRELRRKLEKRGHAFQSDHSDTEVLLLGYRQWGTRLPKHLHGMFAFAVWDEGERTLLLVRDRVGKKPLYFAASSDEIVFGSLAATVAAGMPEGRRPGLCTPAMLEFLRLGFTGRRTMLEGVEEVPPASVLSVSATGKLGVEAYWRPPPVSKHSTSLGAVDALDEVLGEAVGKRLESDVPMVAMLSGGLDSALVAAVAAKKAKALGGDRLQTVSVDIPAIGYFSSGPAKRVADAIDTRHVALTAELGEAHRAIDDLERLMRHAGEPLADPALLPTYWTYKAIRGHASAVLSGAGGEEVFGGWPRYRMLARVARYRWWLERLPRLFHNAPPDTHRWRLGRCIDAAKAGTLPSQQYHQLVHVFTDRQIAELAPGLFPTLGEYGSHPAADWPPVADPTHAAMRWDLAHVVPHRLLRRVDRGSMAVPIEVRLPLLDTAVLDFAAHLPPRVLMPHGRPKGLLKAVAANHLPLSLADARPPTYRLPMADWFRGPLRDPLHARLTDGRLTDAGLKRAEIDRYFHEHAAHRANHTERLLALLGLSLFLAWLER